MGVGLFVTFEGANGVGKTTQANMLAENLGEMKIPAVVAREPGGSRLAEEIRSYLMSFPVGFLNPKEECELYYMARQALVDEFVRPNLLKGTHVILDRYEDSTRVYQGLLGGLGLSTVDEISYRYIKGLKPNLTFLLDTSYEMVSPRLQTQMQEDFDTADELNHSSYDRIRRAYLSLTACEPRRWKIIDSTKSIEAVSFLVLNEMLRGVRETGRELLCLKSRFSLSKK